MKKLSLILTAAASVALLTTASRAADLGARPVYKAPAAIVPTWNWTGFYAGLNAGYGWGDQTLSVSGAGSAGSLKTNLNGFVGGGQIGYNWQAPNNFVFGVEADIDGSSARKTATGTLTVLGVGVTTTATNRLDYLGTVRGRLGYAAGSWMPYITG